MDTKTQEAELQTEMIGILTAISIVSKRLATRLSDLHDKPDKSQQSEVAI